MRRESEDWQLIRISPSREVILQELDLLPKPEQPPKKKPEQPKGSKMKKEAATEEPVKKRGRPIGSKNKPKIQPVAPPEKLQTRNENSVWSTGWESISKLISMSI